MDLVPGMVTFFWFIPTRTGTFDILCAELCGVGHHTMRGIVVVDEPADYEVWLKNQTTFAQAYSRAKPGPKLASVRSALEGNTRTATRESRTRDPD
jgi:cytochrome c oxidase subunit 2